MWIAPIVGGCMASASSRTRKVPVDVQQEEFPDHDVVAGPARDQADVGAVEFVDGQLDDTAEVGLHHVDGVHFLRGEQPGLSAAEFPVGAHASDLVGVPAEADHLDPAGQVPCDGHHDRFGADAPPVDDRGDGRMPDPPGQGVDGLALFGLESLAQCGIVPGSGAFPAGEPVIGSGTATPVSPAGGPSGPSAAG